MKTDKLKRLFVIFLVFALFIGSSPYISPTAEAAAYTPRTSLPDNARSSIKYYCVDSSLGYGKFNPYNQFNIGNCTWYAFGRAWELLGYYPSKLVFAGDACAWFNANKSNFDSGNGGFPYSTDPNAPALGAIACWSKDGNGSSGGHVAVVEQISSNSNGSKTIVTSESGYAGYYFKTEERNTAQKGLGWSSYTFQGYIYIMGTPATQSGDKSIYCTVTSPEEDEVLTKGAHPVIGTITSGCNIKQVVAYIDAVKYADFNVDTTYVSLRNTDVNYKLDFASLDPGYHKLVIYARNSSSGTLDSVLIRTFYINPGEHEHTPGSYCGYYEAHPHYIIYQCGICGQKWYSAESTYNKTDCRECNRPFEPIIVSPSKNDNVIVNDAPIEFEWYENTRHGYLTTHYNTWLYRLNDNGQWETYRHEFYSESGMALLLREGQYRFVLQAYNSNWYEEDGSDWLHSESERYFTVLDEDSCELKGHSYVKGVCTNCGQPDPDHRIIIDYDETVVEGSDTYRIPVVVDGNVGFSSFSLPVLAFIREDNRLRYDGCQVVKIEKGELLQQASGNLTIDSTNPKYTNLNWNGTTDIVDDGVLLYVTIKIESTEKDTKCGVSLAPVYDIHGCTHGFTNSSGYAIQYTFEDKNIYFIAHTHAYSAVETKATCTEQGYTTYTCGCGDKYISGYTEPLGHNYVGGVCTRCGETNHDYVVGDLNGDGDITSADAVMLSRYLAGLAELTAEQLLAADINSDGDVTSADSVILARFLAGIVASLK